MKNTALLLTQYERYGTIGKEEYIENFINEELFVDASMIYDYNVYLGNNGYEEYWDWDCLNEMLCNVEPIEIARMTFYGDFNFAADYHKFNGYGNIDSFSEWQVIQEMKEDRDFLEWYVEENDLINFESDEYLEAIQEANNLLAMGY